MPQIELRELCKTYRVGDAQIRAVDGVSLKIDKGDFISIVGHSGSGKTTLLSMIGGILRPTEGSLLFEGTDIYGLGKDGLSRYRAEKVGYIFQFASLLPVLTALENLLLPSVFREGGRVQDKKAIEYLDIVGLSDKADSYPSELSGGQQRRVAIARALINDPEVILADEPTGDLDEDTEVEVMEFLKKVNSENVTTLILVTHSTELAKAAKIRLRMSRGSLQSIQ